MTSLKTSIKTITYLSDTGCLEIQGASLWTLPDENPPIGLVLCAEKGAGEAHYALAGLPNTVLASEYKMQLPDEKRLADELVRTQAVLEEGYRRR